GVERDEVSRLHPVLRVGGERHRIGEPGRTVLERDDPYAYVPIAGLPIWVAARGVDRVHSLSAIDGGGAIEMKRDRRTSCPTPEVVRLQGVAQDSDPVVEVPEVVRVLGEGLDQPLVDLSQAERFANVAREQSVTMFAVPIRDLVNSDDAVEGLVGLCDMDPVLHLHGERDRGFSEVVPNDLPYVRREVHPVVQHGAELVELLLAVKQPAGNLFL